jgi:hypothetical protein
MQRMLRVKAIRPHLYGTRRLEAGDEYEAPAEEAIAHVATRKADFIKQITKPPVAAPKPAAEPPPAYEATQREAVEATAETSEASPLDELRQQAGALGINVDGRWGIARLRYEIEQAKRR